ncbi:hypothetical protein [Pedobacter frigoris]|uniref:hypothetical protein n=1 Tax=Pedobacter frigoris TaxID=2571272 RepID=UPI00145E136E|nr:hypothetical protein [Pedobacter frigoris]
MMKCLVLNQVPEGILRSRSPRFGCSKDVFPSTETSLPAPAGNEGAAELAPSGKTKRLN